MTASIPLAWLGTYLIHSTLLLGAVWLATRWLRRRSAPLSLALEERLWKTAVVGALLTATLQIALAYAPGVDLPAPVRWGAEQAVPRVAATPTPVAPPAPSSTVAAPAMEASALATTPRPHPGLASVAALVPGWQRLVLAAWLLGAAAGLALLALSWVGLHRTLRGRRTVGGGATRRALDRLLTSGPSRRPVRLSASERLPVPVALGVFEREICVPERALETFGPRRQEGLLAHELAHLERRDPAWTLALRTLEAGLFLQPLNRVARRRLLEIAEHRCDTWAVERTGDRVGLARSLTDVATWLAGVEPPPVASPVPGMAGDRRALGRRVRRILDGPAAGEGRPPGRWSLALAAAALLAIGCLAPGVAPAVTADGARAAVAEPTQERDEATRAAERAEATEATRMAEAAEEAEMAERAEKAERRARVYHDYHGEWESDHDADLDLEELEALEALEAELEELEELGELEMHLELDPHLELEVERLARMAEELARHAEPDLEALEELEGQLEEIVERSMADREAALEHLHEALAHQLDGVGRVHELSAAERARLEEDLRRLSDEARRIAEEARPDEEELERIHEQARRLAAEARPSQEEMERLNREAERMSREIERLHRDELRQVEEQVLRNRERIERRVREEVRRELEAMEAALDAEREEMRSAEEGMAAEYVERRRELEKRHRELKERRQELEEERLERLEESQELEEESEPPR